MKKALRLFWLPALYLSAVFPAGAQSASAPIRLIVRSDDLGYTHSANTGIRESFENGITTTVEVMAPTPWFPEAVALLREMPGADVGTHLTLTSEWTGVKWRPLTHAPSLTDEDGYFFPIIWPNDNFPPGSALLEHNWKIEEVERELRAQIELARRHIPQLSHLTTHMGCLDINDDTRALFRRLAKEYGLNIIPEDYGVQRLRYGGNREMTVEQRTEKFIEELQGLPPGDWLLVEHPAHDSPEQRAVGHPKYEDVAADRSAVLKTLTDERVKQVIRERGIELISYADLKHQPMPRLKVSENGRFLVKEDGSPFFYLGDTAWELFHRLNREEATEYLRNRAENGFTVIQAVVLAEIDGLFIPNPYGHVPLENLDPTRPIEAYFEHVDFIVDQAERQGLYVGMLPTWGDKVFKVWGVGPEIFTPENAKAYGEFLGRRYKDKPIIWILGGDRWIETDRHREIWNAMARGLEKGDGGNHLMTYHPSGWQTSATWFHEAEWLDFNMHQSGHGGRNTPNWQFTQKTYRMTPVKPTMDGEPCYEGLPVKFYEFEKDDMRGILTPEAADTLFKLGWFDDYDVRKAAYWSLLSGACGHTYGNNNIWQMYAPGRKPNIYCRSNWRQAMDHPGGRQMSYVRKLFESHPFLLLEPDEGLLLNDPGEGPDKMMAARASDGSYAYCYTPAGQPIRVDVTKMAGKRCSASWYNPRNGESTTIGTFGTSEALTFTPPGSGAGNDWVLVLENGTR
ncbi:MAG: DUF4038 domain-containing protein [Phaeodactylibacter sp.]|nr:DUF4038 domain-containing protein [Phaeodactylibacter sp.]